MARHGLPFSRDVQHEPCRYSMQDGYAAAQRLLERAPHLSAVFALGDVIALGAMRAARDGGSASRQISPWWALTASSPASSASPG